MEQAMPTLIDTAPGSRSALWLGRLLNGLSIAFPQFSHIMFGLYLGWVMWGGPLLDNRSFRILLPFSS
jgi:hypothetical protein